MPVNPLVKQERQELTEDKTTREKIYVKQRTRWQLVQEERISEHRDSNAQKIGREIPEWKPKPLNKKSCKLTAITSKCLQVAPE